MTWWWLGVALAQGPSELPADPPITFVPVAVANDESAIKDLEVVAPGARTEIDVELWVRKDGNWFLGDKLIVDSDFEHAFRPLLAENPARRLLVSAHEEAPYGRITEAVKLGRDVGFTRVAVEVTGVRDAGADDPLFDDTSGFDQVDLTALEDPTRKDIREAKPKRHKFEQNPYAHVDFTAYTLERGETRIGLTAIGHGLTPRVQLVTVPLLDMIGAWNTTLKANLVRQGNFDGALLAGVYYVPITDILNNLGVGEALNPTNKQKNTPTFTSSLTWLDLGVKTSARLTDPWSAHLGFTYSRVFAEGELSLGQIPRVDVPQIGEIGGQQIKIVPKVASELLQLRFATDYRFNRRDTLILQFGAPVYFSARGLFSANDTGLSKDFSNLYAAVGYQRWLPVGTYPGVSIAWQFSWKHVDLRVGIPLAASSTLSRIQSSGQAFNLTYRFGGSTRKGEREIRQDYRQDRRTLRRTSADPVEP